VLPPTQASSQQLTVFLREQIGKSFSYDIHTRTFISSNEAKTISEVVDRWSPREMSPSPRRFRNSNSLTLDTKL
jgi:Domain of unknown function (DUF6434)